MCIRDSLTTNALESKLMEQTGFGSDGKYEITEKTLLKDKLKVTKDTGRITAIENTSLTGSSSPVSYTHLDVYKRQFLALIGIPVLTIEFSIGRASQKSTAKAYQELEPRGTKWHLHSNFAIAGNYILLMFYTTVAGWMLYYFYKFAVGGFVGLDTANVKNTFNNLLASPATMTFWLLVVVVLGFGVCSLGLQKGVEKITKVMMTALLGLIIILAIHAVRLDGGIDGVKFYLDVYKRQVLLLPNYIKAARQ